MTCLNAFPIRNNNNNNLLRINYNNTNDNNNNNNSNNNNNNTTITTNIIIKRKKGTESKKQICYGMEFCTPCAVTMPSAADSSLQQSCDAATARSAK